MNTPNNISTQIIVDDTDPRIQYDNNADWTPERISDVNTFSHSENGQVIPMYGTVHAMALSADNPEQKAASTIKFQYDGTTYILDTVTYSGSH